MRHTFSSRLAFVLALAAASLAGSPVCIAAPPEPAHARDTLAFRRAEHLRHGINTSIWFAQHPADYSVERLRSFTTEDDLALIARLGFDHIRLSIDAVPLEAAFAHDQPGAAGAPFLQELDRVIHATLAQKLAVVLDVHPEDAYKAELLHGTGSVARFERLWQALAARYKDLDPELVFFEIMNEPEQDDGYRWQGIEAAVAQSIRAVAPRQTIIAAGAHYSGLQDLLRLEPIALSNVIYTFHDYEPFAFTHQGATWTDAAVRPLRDVPYPSTPKNIAANEQQEPTLEGRYFVSEYGWARWDAARVDATVAFAEQWSRQFGVPVYCGEFGVHRPYADPAARARWAEDMRTALEKHHIGWAMWDYQTDFGVVTKKDGVTTPDAEMLRALGLNVAAK